MTEILGKGARAQRRNRVMNFELLVVAISGTGFARTKSVSSLGLELIVVMTWARWAFQDGSLQLYAVVCVS